MCLKLSLYRQPSADDFFCPDSQLIAEKALDLIQIGYEFKKYYLHAKSILTNNPSFAAMRGFGIPQMIFAVERQIDLIAKEVGIDSLTTSYTSKKWNTGTIGGNIVNASPSADSLPALMALEARLVLTSKLMEEISFILNGNQRQIKVAPDVFLIDVLRDQLGLTGTKRGCNKGDCGSCSVLINGKLVNSCLVLAVQVKGKTITTIEGLANDEKLHPIQKAFIDAGAIQCGYCTPGMVLAAKALLDENPNPSLEEIKKGLSGNLCRCTGYAKIFKAVEQARENNCANERINKKAQTL